MAVEFDVCMIARFLVTVHCDVCRRECEAILGDKSAAQCSNEQLKTSLNNAQARYSRSVCLSVCLSVSLCACVYTVGALTFESFHLVAR